MVLDRKIDYGIFSHFLLEVENGTNIDDILRKCDSICWFLSFLTLNSTFSPIFEIYSGEDLVFIGIADSVKEKFHNNYLVDNKAITDGIKNSFSAYDRFEQLHTNIELWRLITMLNKIQSQKYKDFKIAYLLIAYKFFLTKYLLYEGMNTNSISKMNIQTKLGTFNKRVLNKYIHKKYLGDYLRDSIRNPLFHQGNLALLSFDEKFHVYTEYYELLIQIILKSLGYNGKYISRKNYKVVDLL